MDVGCPQKRGYDLEKGHCPQLKAIPREALSGDLLATNMAKAGAMTTLVLKVDEALGRIHYKDANLGLRHYL